MPKALSDQDCLQYEIDGALAPVRVFSEDRAATYLGELQRFEADHPDLARSVLTVKPHLVLRWADEIVHDPAVLDVIEDLLGPDILLYNTAVWIKEPGDLKFVGWHQDCAYYPLDPPTHVTAWISLTDSVEENGNVKFLVGSHTGGLMGHTADGGTSSLLSQGQSIHRDFDGGLIRSMPLLPGQMSLHHAHAVHYSEPNRSDRRRIGFGMNFIPTSVRGSGSVRHSAMLVRGTDRFRHFNAEPRVDTDLSPCARSIHREAVSHFRAARDEAVEAHDRKFAGPLAPAN